MTETLGERWAQHMRSGSSRILQLAGPTESLSPLRRPFFDAFRIMEASRAILYGDGTFLSQDEWLYYDSNPTTGKQGKTDALHSILTLVIQTSSFSKMYSGIKHELQCVSLIND